MPTPLSKTRPTVSIVICFYNPGRFFQLALQSVFAQTFTDWELLLLDDGSTDGSLDLALGIGDERVRVFSDGARKRANFRLNEGTRLARGEYLFRMDADDVMHPDRLAVQLPVLKACSPETVLGTACYSIDSQSNVVGWRPVRKRRRTGFAARYSFVHPTVAASTEWFRRNPYSTDQIYKRGQDAELWCRTASFSDFRWIEQPLLFYREMGVFSLQNYLAGEDALLDLISHLEQRAIRRLWLRTKERVKMAAFRGLVALHCSDLIVRHRFRKLTSNARSDAEQLIRQITQMQLPVK